jgi:hypothetical protein
MEVCLGRMPGAFFATLTCARCPAKIDVTPEVRVQSTSKLHTPSDRVACTNGPQTPWQSHAKRPKVKYVRGALATSSLGQTDREYTTRLAKDSVADPPQKCALSATQAQWRNHTSYSQRQFDLLIP